MKYSLMMIGASVLLASTAMPACAYNSDVEAALRSQGDLSMFYEAFHNSGVAAELQEGASYTIFAPTNAAFAEIQPNTYPCFYSAQCRPQLAAVIRDHIVPESASLREMSKWGDTNSLGNREVIVLEAYKGQYTVDGRQIMNNSDGTTDVSLYRINGVIASESELAPFRRLPYIAAVPEVPGTVVEKTVTTYHTVAPAPVAVTTYVGPGPMPVPGGAAPPQTVVIVPPQ
jgi:uncharacterized surface protein with fasciclin (FAS1) repeats